MNKRPDNIALFCIMALGVYLSYLMLSNPWFSLIMLLMGVVFVINRGTTIYISVLLIGIVIFLSRNYNFYRSDTGQNDLSGKEITVTGKILSIQSYGLNYNITIKADTLFLQNKSYISNLNFSSIITGKDIRKGDNIKISGIFQKFKPPTNKYEKDMIKSSFINNLYGEIINPKKVVLIRNNGIWRKISLFQNYITEVFDKRLSYTAGNFLSAVMIGKRDKLDSAVIKEFADSGTIHLLAVSGLHVGFVIMILSLLSSALNIKGALYIILNSAALLGYAVFTGGSPSVIRAVLMAIILMISYPLKRKIKFIDIIGTAGMISLAYEPNQIFSPGFILSFGAVASIAIIYEPMSKNFNNLLDIRNYYLKKISDGIVLSVSVTVGLLPFVLFMFGKYNFISIISNLILIPLTGIAFLSGILLLLVNKFNLVSIFIADVINVTVKAISEIVSYSARLEIFTLKYKFDIIITLILICVVITVFYLKNYRYKLIFSITLTVVLIFEIIFLEIDPVIYIFYTKSKNTFIIEDRGVNILIAGKLSRSEIRRILKPYMHEKNIVELDYYISYDEWYELEQTLNDLDIPVKNIIGDKDIEMLNGDFNISNLKYLNEKVKYSGGELDLSDDDFIKIVAASGSYILKRENDNDSGIEIKLMKNNIEVNNFKYNKFIRF